uniref:Ankyrin repeat protein n=1 Tax=Pithovirus LCPAC406 TaxID=2506599 RepID=A0A481ZIG3_9VIRU|nr:MAG: uncharacterized protein LCPAC406_02650 [Pithovirus LCPAC406]
MDVLKHVHGIFVKRYRKMGFVGGFKLISLKKTAINIAMFRGNNAAVKYLGTSSLSEDFWKDIATIAISEGNRELAVFIYKKYYRYPDFFMEEAIKSYQHHPVFDTEDERKEYWLGFQVIDKNIDTYHRQKAQYINQYLEIVKYFKDKCSDIEDHLYHAAKLGKIEIMKLLETKYDPDKYLVNAIISKDISILDHVLLLVSDTFKAICETIALDYVTMFIYIDTRRTFTLNQRKKMFHLALRYNARDIIYCIHDEEIIKGENWDKHLLSAIKKDYVNVVIYIIAYHTGTFKMKSEKMINIAESCNSSQCVDLLTFTAK